MLCCFVINSSSRLNFETVSESNPIGFTVVFILNFASLLRCERNSWPASPMYCTLLQKDVPIPLGLVCQPQWLFLLLQVFCMQVRGSRRVFRQVQPLLLLLVPMLRLCYNRYNTCLINTASVGQDKKDSRWDVENNEYGQAPQNDCVT